MGQNCTFFFNPTRTDWQLKRRYQQLLEEGRLNQQTKLIAGHAVEDNQSTEVNMLNFEVPTKSSATGDQN